MPAVPNFAQVINLIVTDVLGEQRAREIRARVAGMGWNQAVAYRLTQTTQALSDLESATEPGARWRFKQRIPPTGAPGRAQVTTAIMDWGLGPPNSIGRIVEIPGLSRIGSALNWMACDAEPRRTGNSAGRSCSAFCASPGLPPLWEIGRAHV